MVKFTSPCPLQVFDFENPKPLRCQDITYLRYYRAFFDAEDVSQHLGVLALSKYNIACYWFKKTGATSTVLLLHGYTDHVALYRHCIKALLDAGYNVLAIDLPGHGLSEGESAAIDSFASYQQVLIDLVDILPDSITDSLFLVAQSTGCAIATSYLQSEKNHPFEKQVLFAPLVRPAYWWFIRIKLLLGRAFIHQVKRVFRKNSNNAQFLQFIKYDDPLQARYIKVSWVRALSRWQKVLLKKCLINTPSLIVQGDSDNVVAWRYNIKQLQKKLSKVQLIMLPKGRHHIVNEREGLRQQAFAAMLDFLQD